MEKRFVIAIKQAEYMGKKLGEIPEPLNGICDDLESIMSHLTAKDAITVKSIKNRIACIKVIIKDVNTFYTSVDDTDSNQKG
jgi:hypothetical protein